MSTEELMFSVILPVRNGDPVLLRRALNSVKEQTYPDYEILLINDGSDEEHARQLEEISREYEKIRIFHIPPSGVSGARNHAVTLAQGDILTYLDGDDALSPFCFEEAAILFRRPDIDALWGGTIYAGQEEMNDLLTRMKEKKAHTEEELAGLTVSLTPERIHRTRAECIGEPFRFDEGGYINRGIAGRFLRKEAYAEERCRFPEGIRIYEDTIWNLEMMNTLRICYVKSVWYCYYANESSVSNRYSPDIVQMSEVPLQRIRQILDTDHPEEYTAYTRFLMDALRYVYKCLYGSPAWKPQAEEKRKLRNHLYNEQPWKEIASRRYMKYASKRDSRKALLFRMHLLFLYWKRVWKNM